MQNAKAGAFLQKEIHDRDIPIVLVLSQPLGSFFL
ncbi:hypothetical protein M2282_005221 [Variovorax boronicumulans]|nr:hypothetical protein [Variovorax boronicumulans]